MLVAVTEMMLDGIRFRAGDKVRYTFSTAAENTGTIERFGFHLDSNGHCSSVIWIIPEGREKAFKGCVNNFDEGLIATGAITSIFPI